MQIIKYDGTQAEQDRITAEKQAEGLILTHVSNVTEGNFLGFMENSIPVVTPLETRLDSIENTLDLLLLKQEGIL